MRSRRGEAEVGWRCWLGTNARGLKMKKYITLVFEYETDADLAVIRELAGAKQCRAWSMDHEIVRNDLVRQAVEDGDTGKAMEYIKADGVAALLPELRSA